MNDQLLPDTLIRDALIISAFGTLIREFLEGFFHRPALLALGSAEHSCAPSGSNGPSPSSRRLYLEEVRQLARSASLRGLSALAPNPRLAHACGAQDHTGDVEQQPRRRPSKAN